MIYLLLYCFICFSLQMRKCQELNNLASVPQPLVIRFKILLDQIRMLVLDFLFDFFYFDVYKKPYVQKF